MKKTIIYSAIILAVIFGLLTITGLINIAPDWLLTLIVFVIFSAVFIINQPKKRIIKNSVPNGLIILLILSVFLLSGCASTIAYNKSHPFQVTFQENPRWHNKKVIKGNGHSYRNYKASTCPLIKCR